MGCFVVARFVLTSASRCNSIASCLLWAKLSQDLLDRFSWFFFHQMEDICVNFLEPFQFFWSQGRCHGNQFCGKITYPPPAFIVLAFRNGMGYRYLNVRTNSVNHACISCETIRELWSNNSRENGAYLWTFCMTWQKMAYLVEYLRIY